MWTLEAALEFVRREQDWAMERGYYIAIAGGVINKGHGKDLDLVLMPRWEMTPDPRAFIFAWAERLGLDEPHITDRPTGYHVHLKELIIEYTIVIPYNE